MNEGSGAIPSHTVKQKGRSQPFRMRPATATDTAVIARHRALMFQDMGQLPPPAFDPLCSMAEKVLAGSLALNVFTEPAWRRRGLAELLMRYVLQWARDQCLDRLVLHASEEGRALYQRLGFVATNEMRFSGSLLGQEVGRG